MNNITIRNKRYYTVAEAVEITGVTRQGIHYLIKNKWKKKVESISGKGRTNLYLIPARIIDNYERREPNNHHTDCAECL
jgi:hypothetical protein